MDFLSPILDTLSMWAVGLGDWLHALLTTSEYGPLFAGLIFGSLLSWLIYTFLVLPAQLKVMEKEVKSRKDQFVSLASHYLLNPITIIQTAVSRLQETDVLSEGERARLYEAILRGNQRLWITTEQIMIVNEIDKNELRLKVEVQNISEIVSSAITTVDPFARYKEISIVMSDNTKELQEAKIDTRRIKQAIVAVLDNAVKFSPEKGQILIALDYQSGIFSIEVSDSGVGIPQDIVSKVGQEFFRGSQIYNFDYEGFGLGLYIAKSILAFHQGTIQFGSKPGEGTKVRIEFPGF